MAEVPDITAAVARTLQALRADRGWSLDQLAARSGVSKGVLVALEQGRSNPNLATLARIGDAFGVPVTLLVDLGGEPAVQISSPDGSRVLWRGPSGGTGTIIGATGRLRALGYGAVAGAGFGLFFLCLKNAGQSGVLWPVAISRTAGTLVAVGIALATGTRPWREGGGTGVIALVSGAVDAAANVCYVLATRAGLFGLAVVITSLYPGMTVLLARWVLGERMRWLQRGGLLLAAVGVVLVAA